MISQARPSGEAYYDIFDDWELIEASFLKQYGIRLRTENDMLYPEFCSLLSGIMHDTPLGQIVSIRAEKNPEVIRNFSDEQKRIRSEWMSRKCKKLKGNTSEYIAYWQKQQAAFKAAFGKRK